MATSIFIALFGAAFVLLGRWLYQHPSTLHPSWGFFNSENPEVQKLARAQATFVIFFGSFAFGGAIAVYVLPMLAPIFALALGIAGAWFLRPRQPRPAPGHIGEMRSDSGNITQKHPLLGKHWKRFLAIAAGCAILFSIFIVGTLGDSDISKLAFAQAQTNVTIRQRLGEPIERGFWMSGSLEISGPSGRADLAIPIHGPKGSATVYVVAQKSAGLWKYETLQVAFSGKEDRFDLLNTPNGSSPTAEEK